LFRQNHAQYTRSVGLNAFNSQVPLHVHFLPTKVRWVASSTIRSKRQMPQKRVPQRVKPA
ncbi:MAG: hypothetical protein OCC49_07935, partial [Fibrobacterales bacterium]